MTQVWDDDNRVVPVTVVQVAPGTFVQFAGAFAGGITGTWLSHARAIRRHEAACPGHAARNSPGTKEQ